MHYNITKLTASPDSRLHVPIAGHQWEKHTLTPPMPKGQETTGFRVYNPFEETPTLFLEFSRIDLTKGAIRSFADRYGNVEKQTFSGWKKEIQLIQQAIELWDAVRNKTASPVSEELKVAQWNALLVDYLHRDERKPGRRKADSTVIRQVAKNALEPEAVLRALLNDVFYNRCQVSFDQEQWGTQLQVQGLANVVWVQWLVAVTENQEFRDCEQCGKPMALGLETSRTDRKFCSNLCQMKAYRGRIEAARRMRHGGATLRSIARELETEIDTVKGWVGEG